MDKYLGYRKKTKEEIEFLWKNAVFTFDTNSLLNLYRYSPTSRKDIFEIINKISTRIFLTNQVTFEFNKNRYENINNLIKNHNDFVATLEKINNEIISKSSSPLLSKTISENQSSAGKANLSPKRPPAEWFELTSAVPKPLPWTK